MKFIGGVLIALGVIGVFSGGGPPPGSSSAYALGYTLAPLLFIGAGWFMVRSAKDPS